MSSNTDREKEGDYVINVFKKIRILGEGVVTQWAKGVRQTYSPSSASRTHMVEGEKQF